MTEILTGTREPKHWVCVHANLHEYTHTGMLMQAATNFPHSQTTTHVNRFDWIFFFCFHHQSTFPCTVKQHLQRVFFFRSRVGFFFGCSRRADVVVVVPPPIQDSVPWKRRALLLILSPERKRKAFLSEMASLVIKGHSARRPQTAHVVSLCGSGERETQCSQCSPPWQRRSLRGHVTCPGLQPPLLAPALHWTVDWTAHTWYHAKMITVSLLTSWLPLQNVLTFKR